MASLISLRSLAPSLSLFFLFSFAGEGLYMKLCASCHGEDRLGRTAPPLIPDLMRFKTEEDLRKVIREGIPASNMPGFDLSRKDLESLIRFIRSPIPEVRWDLDDSVRTSRTLVEREKPNYGEVSLKDLVVFVDKGKGRVVLLRGSEVIDSFPFRNVHGGVKFTEEGFYIPSRDGWVIYYSLRDRRPEVKLRACVYLRNVAVNGNLVAVACTLPRSLLIADRLLRPERLIPLEGRPSAVYPYRDGFVVGFRDRPLVALVGKDGSIRYVKVDTPLEDFFIDPFSRYLVGSSREVEGIVVYELPDFKKVTSVETGSLPHLFATAFWYWNGTFFFGARHINDTKVTLWDMTSFKKVAEVDTGSNGFFVRTHPSTPYLWLDGGDGELVLVDKRSFEVRRVELPRGGKVTHVEFSGDGELAYVSVKGQGLLILDARIFKEVAFLKTPLPSGKYNPLMKTGKGLKALLGFEVFMRKCWGCHHPTRQAFGPSFRWIAESRSRDLIVARMINPVRPMPKIDLSPEEVEALISFMEVLRDGWFD